MADKNIFRRIYDAVIGTESTKEEPKAFIGNYNYGGGRNVYTVSYDGEKNLGEAGPVIDYVLDYPILRIRSWQAYTESEIAKTVLDKFVLWMISKGLNLQSNPAKFLLSNEGINFDTEKYNNIVESRFSVWSNMRECSYSGMDNLNTLAQTAFKNAKIGGDVLVVLRYVDGVVKIQLIDGAHVQSPYLGSDYFANVLANGNTVRNGVEMTAKGEHIAYYVLNADYTYDRIEAKSKTGLITAYLVYGSKQRLDNSRGLPLIAICLETIKKLERYKEATVGSAEERAKIVMQIVHDRDSTGENPLAQALTKGRYVGGNNTSDDLPISEQGKQLANTIAATTNKSTYNMPIGSELKALQSDNELAFKEFYSTNADIICGAVNIPPNVAFSIYNDSFSASRAATKDWEHTIIVNREDITFQFYKPIFNFWQYIEILNNKIQAPGYLLAMKQKDYMILGAFQNIYMTGSMFPHIDPLKEVAAERLKLGDSAANIPLTTVQRSTEVLNTGDSNSNIEQYSQELDKVKKLDIIPEVQPFVAPK